MLVCLQKNLSKKQNFTNGHEHEQNGKMKKQTQLNRREIMQRIRSKNTKPEIIVRKLVFSLGYRYRLHRKDIPGNPDIAFIGRKKAIFIHGCFWHFHQSPICKISHLPKSNLDFWEPKLLANCERDKKNEESLFEIGWDCLIIWECELKNLDELKSRIINFLG